jgi:hypothetical protein
MHMFTCIFILISTLSECCPVSCLTDTSATLLTWEDGMSTTCSSNSIFPAFVRSQTVDPLSHFLPSADYEAEGLGITF